MSQYNALIYVGRAISFVIQEYQTRRSIELKKNIPFIKNEGFSVDEISYYNQLRGIGVELTKVPTRKVNKEVDSEVKDELDDEVEVDLSDKSDDDLSDDIKDQLHDTEVPEVELMDVSTDSDEDDDKLVDETIEVEEGYESELSEYLDVNYSEEELHELAEDLGTADIRSNFRKGTVIDRLIENSYDDVYRLLINKL